MLRPGGPGVRLLGQICVTRTAARENGSSTRTVASGQRGSRPRWCARNRQFRRVPGETLGDSAADGQSREAQGKKGIRPGPSPGDVPGGPSVRRGFRRCCTSFEETIFRPDRRVVPGCSPPITTGVAQLGSAGSEKGRGASRHREEAVPASGWFPDQVQPGERLFPGQELVSRAPGTYLHLPPVDRRQVRPEPRHQAEPSTRPLRSGFAMQTCHVAGIGYDEIHQRQPGRRPEGPHRRGGSRPTLKGRRPDRGWNVQACYFGNAGRPGP